jgi:hypothetical protein
MSFKTLRDLTETDEQKSKAAQGFAERLKAYEKRFADEAKQLTPSDRFYERCYNI